MTYLAIAALLAAGCSSDSGAKPADAAHIDAPRIDAPHADARRIDATPIPPDGATSVITVTCPVSAVPTITVVESASDPTGFAYAPLATGTGPNLTIAAGDIVKFDLGGFHDANPSDAVTGCTSCVSDPGMHTPFGDTLCKKFQVAGDYGMFCSAHNFRGHILVH